MNIIGVCTEAVEKVLMGKRVKYWGEKGTVVGINLKVTTPIQVRFDTQDPADVLETPWGFTYEQLEWLEVV